MSKTNIRPLELYCALMEEIKGRISWVNTVAQGRAPLPHVLSYEFCTLQIRMVCELMAIGCIAIHNDTSDVKTLEKQWSANEIMVRLEKLNPHSFPAACVVNRVGEGFDAFDVVPAPMTRPDFLRIYGQCGGNLHRGHLRRIVAALPAPLPDFSELQKHTNQIIGLLKVHRIATADQKKHYICRMENGPPGSKCAIVTAEGWLPAPRHGAPGPWVAHAPQSPVLPAGAGPSKQSQSS